MCGFFIETNQETTFSTWADKTHKKKLLVQSQELKAESHEDVTLQGLPEIMESLLDFTDCRTGEIEKPRLVCSLRGAGRLMLTP